VEAHWHKPNISTTVLLQGAHVVHLAVVVGTAVGVFVGTNLDDFALLLVFVLGMPQEGIRPPQIVFGQYLGFSALLLVSGVAAAGLRTVPEHWVGLLGFVPIGLGVVGLVRAGPDPPVTPDAMASVRNVAAIATVTVANGVDNVSVYVLLFRQLNLTDTIITTVVFLLLLAVWCTTALAVGRRARLVPGAVRASRLAAPLVLVAIGVYLLSHTGVF